MAPGETAAGRREIEDILPSQPPNWDPNSNGGREALLQYRRALLRGLKAAARKPTNFSKVSEVIQDSEYSLCDSGSLRYQEEAPENRRI